MTVEQIKQQVNIVEVVGNYLDLKQAGDGSKSLCPFHDEKTPSFYVNPSTQTYYCFGACQSGGDVIKFLQRYLKISFSEACFILGGDTLTAETQSSILTAEEVQWVEEASAIADAWKRIFYYQADKNTCRNEGSRVALERWSRINADQGDVFAISLFPILKKFDDRTRPEKIKHKILADQINQPDVASFIFGSESYREQCLALIKNV